MPSEANSKRDPRSDILALERDVGVRSGFFDNLLSEGDDWSFVIKIHALVEAAISHLLSDFLGYPDLESIFTYLELSNNRTGKIAFARAVGCLDEGERLTIRKLSELRNRLVHDVSNVDFDFENWAEGLDRNQLSQFADALGPGGETFAVGEKEVPSVVFFKENPRIDIWFACLFLLSLVYQRKDLAKLKRDVNRQRAALADDLLTSGRLRIRHPADETG